MIILVLLRKTRIIISDYGVLSSKKKELTAACKRFKIPCRLRHTEWTSSQQIVDGDLQNKNMAEERFRNCATTCFQLLRNKLYHCPFLAHGDVLRAFPNDKYGFVDLLDNSEENLKFLSEYIDKTFVPLGCRFCSGSNRNLPYVPIAEQISAPVPYKRYD